MSDTVVVYRYSEHNKNHHKDGFGVLGELLIY